MKEFRTFLSKVFFFCLTIIEGSVALLIVFGTFVARNDSDILYSLCGYILACILIFPMVYPSRYIRIGAFVSLVGFFVWIGYTWTLPIP